MNFKWRLADGYPKCNDLKVFGAFVCAGGSTMGYKLAGFNHLGGIEIDTHIAPIYRVNHKPKLFFNEDVRTFNKRTNLPDELFSLDVLDGSPPCSLFSTSGLREDGWNKEKKFREGQNKQRLDDLVFEYVKTIELLKPKVFVLENVEGLIKGNAKAYVIQIVNQLKKIGYDTQIFLLNSGTMGVPQVRKRVFFIGRKVELKLSPIKLVFNENPIFYGTIEGKKGNPCSEFDKNVWDHRRYGDFSFSDVLERIEKRESSWNAKFVYSNRVCPTIVSASGSKLVEFDSPFHLSDEKLIQIQSFPIDFNFLDQKIKYLLGMSVPPLMTAKIAQQIHKQWLSS